MRKRVTLDFKDIDITDALKFLSTTAGLNIIPTKNARGRITLMVEDAPIKDVFDIMLRSNGLAYDRRGEILNIMTEKEYSDLYGKAFSDLRKVKIFRLKYVVPAHADDLCDALKSDIGKIFVNEDSGTLLVMDTPEKIKEIEDAISSLENKNTIIKMFDLKYAEAKEITEQLKSQLDLKKVGYIKPDTRTNQVVVQTLPERMKDIETLIQGLDRKTKEVLVEVRIIQIRLSDTLEKGVEWEGLFNVGEKFGMMYLGSYPFSAVMGDSDPWRSRQTVLKGGLAPDGTSIEPVDYVGSYPFSGTTTDYDSATKSTGAENMHVGIVGKHDFDVVFKYLRTIGDVKIVATPKIAVINNREARIHIGERQAYITNTTTQTASTTTVAEEVTFLDVGIQLFITPTINDEGFVTLNLKPEISSVTSYLTTSQDNKIPILNTSTTETTVMVKDGASVIIGGLKEESDTDNREEVPFLGRIPILGNIFSSSSKTKKRTELLVMVTPHIIEGDELFTGNRRDFGDKIDEEYQDYKPFDEQEALGTFKTYQPYLDIQKDGEKAGIKPVQEF
ncbi:MAG: type II secretion system protein GspD [Candidatus Omnitrophica bacterium]|nr:type II secretion system protein GspD [Candidatus Omnitrophota bacterium]